LTDAGYLLDVNVLIALTEEEHEHHDLVMKWFEATGHKKWGICPFTETGFLRITSNPRIGFHTLEEASDLLARVATFPGYRFWPVSRGWTALTAPFSTRLFGHQQVTDAYLLGLAIHANGILVTLDKAIQYLAGAEHSRHVLLLE
jgi:uncharacterized protein